ncbi:Uma2 family endonuclease [Trichocoleus sp. FACHB-591]|uniref:Uma2 family endonuclease n=1 Tax=Trichocoleus sp. FACHB-591 TaxID=2692872 RepID=UPI00351C14B4
MILPLASSYRTALNRSPDVAWIQQARWNALTPEQKAGFIPFCPDFVIELVSPSDRLTTVQEKMQEYRENGVQLGWLIDRKSQQVEIYRPNCDVEILKSPVSLSGEGILPGFVLSLDSVWQKSDRPQCLCWTTS